MFNIEVSPPLVSLVGSPFVWKVFSDHSAAFLKIMAEPIDGVFELLPVDPVTKLAPFELAEYFKPFLSISLITNAPALHPDACKAFYVKFHQYFGNPPAQNDMTGLDRYILMGRIPKWRQAWFTSLGYTSYMGWLEVGENIGLSWYPGSTKKVLPDQPEMMYFIAPAADEYSLSITLTFDDGSSMVHTPDQLLNCALYQVGSFPVGFSQLNLASLSSKTVVKYVVNLIGTDFSRTYVLDYSVYRDTRYIIFRNSLGGYDTLPCTGEVDESTDIERSIADRVFDVNDLTRLNKRQYNTRTTEVAKVNSGWLDAEEKNWLNDLIESEEVFEVVDGIRQAIMIRNTNLDRSVRSYEPSSVEIEYERLYQVV